MKLPPGPAFPRSESSGTVSSPADDLIGIPCGDDIQEGDALKRIEAALRRLDTGRFGHCLYCGDPIALKRLDQDPAVDSCSTCDEG